MTDSCVRFLNNFLLTISHLLQVIYFTVDYLRVDMIGQENNNMFLGRTTELSELSKLNEI